MYMFAIGIAFAALALATCVFASIVEGWIAEREIRKAREAHLARKRLAHGLNDNERQHRAWGGG